MKFVAVFAFAVCAICLANAVPVVDVAPEVNLGADVAEVDIEQAAAHHRAARATCDLLSGFGVNSSACAAHCVLRGNRGGYCNNKSVCVCRN